MTLRAPKKAPRVSTISTNSSCLAINNFFLDGPSVLGRRSADSPKVGLKILALCGGSVLALDLKEYLRLTTREMFAFAVYPLPLDRP